MSVQRHPDAHGGVVKQYTDRPNTILHVYAPYADGQFLRRLVGVFREWQSIAPGLLVERHGDHANTVLYAPCADRDGRVLALCVV